MTDIHDFSDICPYDDSVFHEKMSALVKEPMFQHAISYVMPKEAIPGLIDDLLKIDNKYDFFKNTKRKTIAHNLNIYKIQRL